MAASLQTPSSNGFLDWKCVNFIKISLKFVPKGLLNDIPVLIQKMARHQPGDNLLSDPMVITLQKHICVTWPQWVNQDLVWIIWIDIPACIMMTSSNGNIFHVTGHLCGEFTGLRWIPAQRPVMRCFEVFFDLCLNKWLRKQSWGWWYATLSRPLWHHCNVKQPQWRISDRLM